MLAKQGEEEEARGFLAEVSRIQLRRSRAIKAAWLRGVSNKKGPKFRSLFMALIAGAKKRRSHAMIIYRLRE